MTVLGSAAYIFGGTTGTNTTASNDIHRVKVAPSNTFEADYSLIPALPSTEGGKTPAPRTKHAACAYNGSIAIYGGCDEHGTVIEEASAIWLFNPEKPAWDVLQPAEASPAPGPRSNASLFTHDNALLLYGGTDASASPLSEVWRLDTTTKTWTSLPSAPAITSNAALANHHLYLLSSSDAMSGQLHYLHLSSASPAWETFTFPTNPMAPGPRARHAGALLPVSTGYGRQYLAFFFGARAQSGDVELWSDMWTLQVPSSAVLSKPGAASSVTQAFQPAKIKDAIRGAVGAESGQWAWAEVEVQVPAELGADEGKLHPGPRAYFGADVLGGASVVFWGGRDAKGEAVGDGWVVRLE